jgi:hypothetical protein
MHQLQETIEESFQRSLDGGQRDQTVCECLMTPSPFWTLRHIVKNATVNHSDPSSFRGESHKGINEATALCSPSHAQEQGFFV